MVSEDGMVECEIDSDDSDDEAGGEQINAPPPPPEFASKASTPAPKAPTPPTQPAPPCPVNRDPYGINQHLKVVCPLTSSLSKLSAVQWVRSCLITALIRQNKIFFHFTYPFFLAQKITSNMNICFPPTICFNDPYCQGRFSHFWPNFIQRYQLQLVNYVFSLWLLRILRKKFRVPK